MVFYKDNSYKLFFVGFVIFFSFSCWGHNAFPHSEVEISASLNILEKAVLLSPELLHATKENSTIPFYKSGKHKIYLDSGFWNLTRAWLRLYIEEIEKHCRCDLDPDKMVQEVRNHWPQERYLQEEAEEYLPQSFFDQKVLAPVRNMSQKWINKGVNVSNKGAHLSSEYGYTVAGLKASAEVAETILSFSLGGLGLHIACGVVDALIIVWARKFQKYMRVFSYSRKTSMSGIILSFKMAWFSHQIKKSRRRVFFHIDQALVFRENELEKVNAQGPKSLFHRSGHRRLWLERLKRKTDPLFEKIAEWEYRLTNENLSAKEHADIERKIKRIRHKIEHIAQVNRKEFFGMRFKRYLLLRSRKGRINYTNGKGTTSKILGKDVLWPISLEENILERVLESSVVTPLKKIPPDEIREGLIEEFLSLHTKEDGPEVFKEKTQAIQLFLQDIEIIFNTKTPTVERLMRARSIEMTLGALNAHYLKIASNIVPKKYNMSFSGMLRWHWIFGKFSREIHEFSDFLASIAITKNKTKIQFYKYESMEKLLAFFNYLSEFHLLLKNHSINKEEFFQALKLQEKHLRSIALLREKKRAFSLMPFTTGQAQCLKLVEKYQ